MIMTSSKKGNGNVFDNTGYLKFLEQIQEIYGDEAGTVALSILGQLADKGLVLGFELVVGRVDWINILGEHGNEPTSGNGYLILNAIINKRNGNPLPPHALLDFHEKFGLPVSPFWVLDRPEDGRVWIERFNAIRFNVDQMPYDEIVAYMTSGITPSLQHNVNHASYHGNLLEGYVCYLLNEESDDKFPPLFSRPTLCSVLKANEATESYSVSSHEKRCRKSRETSMRALQDVLGDIVKAEIKGLPSSLRPETYDQETSQEIKDVLAKMIQKADPKIKTMDPTEIFCNSVRLLEDCGIPHTLKWMANDPTNGIVYCILLADWAYVKHSAQLTDGNNPGAGVISRGGFLSYSVCSTGDKSVDIDIANDNADISQYFSTKNTPTDFLKYKLYKYLRNTGCRNRGFSLAKHGDLNKYMQDCKRSHTTVGMPKEIMVEQLIKDRLWGEYIMQDPKVIADLLKGVYLQHMPVFEEYQKKKNAACSLPIGMYTVFRNSDASDKLIASLEDQLKTKAMPVDKSDDIKALAYQRGTAALVVINVDSTLTIPLLKFLSEFAEQSPVVVLIDEECPASYMQGLVGKPENEKKRAMACFNKTYRAMSNGLPIVELSKAADVDIEAVVMQMGERMQHMISSSRLEERNVHWLLLCGVTGCGKSTVIKSPIFMEQLSESSGTPLHRIVAVEPDALADRNAMVMEIKRLTKMGAYEVLVLDRNTVGPHGFDFWGNLAKTCCDGNPGLKIKITVGAISSATNENEGSAISLEDFALCLSSVLHRDPRENNKLNGDMPNATKVTAAFLWYISDNGRYGSNDELRKWITARYGHCASLPFSNDLAPPDGLKEIMEQIIKIADAQPEEAQALAKECFAREDMKAWLSGKRMHIDEMARTWGRNLGEAVGIHSGQQRIVYNELLIAKDEMERAFKEAGVFKEAVASHVTLCYNPVDINPNNTTGDSFKVTITALVIGATFKAFLVKLQDGLPSQNGVNAHITLWTDADTPAGKVASLIQDEKVVELQSPITVTAVFKRSVLMRPVSLPLP